MKKLFMSLAVIAAVAMTACSGTEVNPEEKAKREAAEKEAAEAAAAEEKAAKELQATKDAILKASEVEGGEVVFNEGDTLALVVKTIGEGDAAVSDTTKMELKDGKWLKPAPAAPAEDAKKDAKKK